jgi:hypothetical protein
VFVGEAGGLELTLELALVDLGEEILEATVVALEDRVLSRHVDGEAAVEPVAHRGAGELAERLVEVVHRHRDAAAGKVVDVELNRLGAVLRRVDESQRSRARHDQVGGAVLVAEGMAADHDRLRPPGHQPRDV